MKESFTFSFSLFIHKSNNMKYYSPIILLFTVCWFLSCNYLKASVVSTLQSGDAAIQVTTNGDGQFGLTFSYEQNIIQTLAPDSAVYLEVRGRKVAGKYNSWNITDNKLICQALITTPRGSEFSVSDTYIAKGSGVFELQRKLDIQKAAGSDSYFNSLFGFISDDNCQKMTENEYFVPGVWYKANFMANGNIPSGIPQPGDTYFYYREDRITLPLVMFRNPASGITTTIIHKDSDPQTVVADGNGISINENYLYGSLGVKRENDILYTAFLYPGTEADTRNGKGTKYHPVKEGLKQEYNLEIVFSKTNNYASAVNKSWTHAFNLYNPTIYNVDLSYTYDGLIETLLKYYVPSTEMGGIRDAPGFPFQVGLDDFLPRGIDYQMGFVGMQIATGYYLFREGIEKTNTGTQAKGESVLNFWANNCLTSLGLPRTWYDPGLNGNKGSFRGGASDIRVCTGGMESLLTAWCFAKRNNIDRPDWISSCKKFGNWLVEVQNADGSYYFSYDHNRITNGKHPVFNYNKFLTICAVRYLIELYIATNDPAYKTAALKAGEFCYKNIHESYCYVACVVDNPQTIDSESGQMALNGFLSLYDLTKEAKWLRAAEQAAIYTESWVYSFEIPVEKDRTGPTSFPRDRSIVGQHLIAIGHAAADLGFAWSSFAFYRLYLETGNKHYLHVARMSAHNSKQSMNWDQSLFPGQAKGLQLEAFGVTIPRRINGIMTTLNWNYAAHLDPMFRFKDAFGTPDMEEVEKMSWEERQRMNEFYSYVQSSNYGQDINTGLTEITKGSFRIYPNPVSKTGELCIELSDVQINNFVLEIYNIRGRLIHSEEIITPPLQHKTNINKVPSGQYILRIKGGDFNAAKKIIIQ